MITNVPPDKVISLADSLKERQECADFHGYIEKVRKVVNGDYTVEIPLSHRNLKVGQNFEGSLRLDARISQAASWLSAAKFICSVSQGDAAHRDQARRMGKFARFGEMMLSRGSRLYNWKHQTNRDFFECGMSVIQQHPRGDFYLKIQDNPSAVNDGVRLSDILWRRRVDPLYGYWAPDEEGNLDAYMISSQREVREIARLARPDRVRALGTDWAEKFSETPWENKGETDEIQELWVGDKGYLIARGGQRLATDDPNRVIAEWENPYGHPPFYIATLGKAPYRSPLHEMYALTEERNYWATMLDTQAAGAIFQLWQLIDESTGDVIAPHLWDSPVPENVLLDMTQPPPPMGPGKRWELAPFEFHDVIPRYERIVTQHEDAGGSVARLLGQTVGPYTAVGTADMMEEHARREFFEALESFEDNKAWMWEDYFKWQKEHHPERVFVTGRQRDTENGAFFDSTIELTGSDIVSEDVRVRLDTRSRMGMVADWRLGREMQAAGDMSFERRVEEGMVPYVEDPEEEVADIFVSGIEKMSLELHALAARQQLAQSLGLLNTGEEIAPPNITRSTDEDPRNTGVGQGPNNASNTALDASSNDIAGRAS